MRFACLRVAVFGFWLVGGFGWFRFVLGMSGFRFAGVVLVALVLLALRALLCVVLRCLAFVLCVPVGMSYSSGLRLVRRFRFSVVGGFE